MAHDEGSNDIRYVRTPGVVHRRVAGEELLVPVLSGTVDTEKLYVLDPVGALIWGALEAPCSVSELAAAVVAEYEVELPQAECDAAAFMGDLEGAGLVGRE